MREISFRLWDTKEKRMLNIGLVDFPKQTIYSATSDDGSFSKSYVKHPKGYGEGWGSINDVIIEQYTGLLDKNGKKIFEGDVMHWDSHWGWYVGYENGAFRRIPLNDIQRMNWKHYTLQQEGLETWEIIGNIHEGEVQE
jgi:uncharacterized phage protein (TIGR01671 family)